MRFDSDFAAGNAIALRNVAIVHAWRRDRLFSFGDIVDDLKIERSVATPAFVFGAPRVRLAG
jgi:hypothetical protein